MVTDGPCPDPGNCDFERDLCGYTNRDSFDQFDWMLGNGKTSSVYTGPKTDHTVGDGSGNSKRINNGLHSIIYFCLIEICFLSIICFWFIYKEMSQFD